MIFAAQASGMIRFPINRFKVDASRQTAATHPRSYSDDPSLPHMLLSTPATVPTTSATLPLRTNCVCAVNVRMLRNGAKYPIAIVTGQFQARA